MPIMARPARIAGFVFRSSATRILIPLDPAGEGFFLDRLRWKRSLLLKMVRQNMLFLRYGSESHTMQAPQT
jgi:hypothetical protein